MSNISSGKSKSVTIYALFVLLLLVLPLLMLVPISLNAGSVMKAWPQEFSLRWYREVWFADDWRKSFYWSLWTASIATIVSLIMGYIAAETLLRMNGFGKSIIEVLVLMPMMIPAVIIAFSTFLLSMWLKPSSNWWMISLGQALLGLPVATMIIASSLRGINENILRAAKSLGASRSQIFFGIKLPLAFDGLVASAALSFLLAFDELLIAVFLTKSGLETLPVRIYDSVTYELNPSVAVVSVLLILMVTMVALISSALQHLIQKKRHGA